MLRVRLNRIVVDVGEGIWISYLTLDTKLLIVVSNDGVETFISKMHVNKGQSKKGNLYGLSKRRIVIPNIEPKGGNNHRSIRMDNELLKQLLD